MHVYRLNREDRLWTVGYFEPDGKWHPLRDYDNERAAMRLTNYLNGGEGDYPVKSFLD